MGWRDGQCSGLPLLYQDYTSAQTYEVRPRR